MRDGEEWNSWNSSFRDECDSGNLSFREAGSPLSPGVQALPAMGPGTGACAFDDQGVPIPPGAQWVFVFAGQVQD
jgi:hypothetical protein